MKKKKQLCTLLATALCGLGLLSTAGLSAKAENQTLPSKYDGREYGYLTPVRDQKRSEMC